MQQKEELDKFKKNLQKRKPSEKPGRLFLTRLFYSLEFFIL